MLISLLATHFVDPAFVFVVWLGGAVSLSRTKSLDNQMSLIRFAIDIARVPWFAQGREIDSYMCSHVKLYIVDIIYIRE